jgi:hypothetical protein
MKRVTGIGGIFFKGKDPVTLGEWNRSLASSDGSWTQRGNCVELWQPPEGQ